MNDEHPTNPADAAASTPALVADRFPPQLYFVVSAVFHYLGPALAVMLFARVAPLGVAWLRIASAALIFALWRRPWRFFRRQGAAARWNIIALGTVLGAMNACFCLAIDRLPLATVGAIEFLGPVALALAGLRSQRNTVALAIAVTGVGYLVRVRLGGEPIGFVFAFANCALFALYIVLGHRVAADGARGGGKGIDQLAAAMLVALVVVTLPGLRPALPALASAPLLLAGVGVGVTSSVVPYVCDQLAMARLPRATFALLLALLPATAALIGVIVLRQLPHRSEVLGIALVMSGIAIHRTAGR